MSLPRVGCAEVPRGAVARAKRRELDPECTAFDVEHGWAMALRALLWFFHDCDHEGCGPRAHHWPLPWSWDGIEASVRRRRAS